jgi:Flp pilus assembly protein TadB
MTWFLAALGAASLLIHADRPIAPREHRSVAALPIPRVPPDRLARPAVIAVAAAVAVLWHPVTGLLVGLPLWWLFPAVVERLDRRGAVRRRESLDRQLPLVAGLLAACLSAGATLARSLRVTADAVPEPSQSLLARTAAASELGAPPNEIAAILADAGSAGWQGLAAAFLRSETTGAPLADLLGVQADHAMYAWFADASAQARASAVRSVLPLALCYLPAFLLLGVAPVVAGLLGSIVVP